MLREYHLRLIEVSKRAKEILDEYESNLRTDLDSKKKILMADKFEKYEEFKNKELNSLVERYLWCQDIMELSNEN